MANIYKEGSEELHQLLKRAGDAAGSTILVPDLQRPYVWTPNQVTLLVDSLIRGWPFGTLLMWKVGHDKLSSIPFRAFWNVVDRTDLVTGGKLTQMNPPTDYHMVLDGQQRVQSLLLALGGDDWGFRLEDRDWQEELKDERPRGRPPKFRHWSKASLCFDLKAFGEEYQKKNGNLTSVDFRSVLTWAIVDPSEGQSKWKKPDNYDEPLDKAYVPENRERFIRLSRIWSAAPADANLKEKHFRERLVHLLNNHGLSEGKQAPYLAPLAELLSTVRDAKLAQVTYLELQEFVEEQWLGGMQGPETGGGDAGGKALERARDAYNEAIVSIFTRLNTAGRTLTREEITLAWLKVGWTANETEGKSAGTCFQELLAELAGRGLQIEIDELVGVVSLTWSIVAGSGQLLTNADLLKGDVIRPMAADLSCRWTAIRTACVSAADVLAERELKYGPRAHFSSSYALGLLIAWLYLAEGWKAGRNLTELPRDTFVKRCKESVDLILDRWVLCTQWAGVWAQSSAANVAGYMKELRATWSAMQGEEDLIVVHAIWTKCMQGFVTGIETGAAEYVAGFNVTNRERVSLYRNILWIWHRLDAKRWEMSKIQLRVGKSKYVFSDVDHAVAFAFWEEKLTSSLPKGTVDAEEALPIVNQLGNCALLEKNFNISKSANSLKSFLSAIHEFAHGKVTLETWAAALGFSDTMLDPNAADADGIATAIADRDARIRADVVRFVKGQAVRADLASAESIQPVLPQATGS